MNKATLEALIFFYGLQKAFFFRLNEFPRVPLKSIFQ